MKPVKAMNPLRPPVLAERGYLTIAFGAPRYLEMGVALGLSLGIHDPGTPRAIVTDGTHPCMKEAFDHIIPFDSSLGIGLIQKIHLDRYSPFEKTVFIDSDCVAFGCMDALWEYFESSEGFSVIGDRKLDRNDRNGRKPHAIRDVRVFLDTIKLDKIPNFNGGVYYFDRSYRAEEVFHRARAVSPELIDFGVKGSRSGCSDEVTYAVAMQQLGVALLPYRKDLMISPIGKIRGLNGIDSLRGKSTFIKSGIKISPLIIHFNVHAQYQFVHRREIRKLIAKCMGASDLIARFKGSIQALKEWRIDYFRFKKETRRKLRKLAG